MKTTLLPTSLLIALLGLGGCFGSSGDSPDAGGDAGSSDGGSDGGPACEAAACQQQCNANDQDGACEASTDTCRCTDRPPRTQPPGSACSCDTDCAGSATHPGVCLKGICMNRPATDCSAAGSRAECPAGSRCWGLSGADFEICWPDCASYSCAGTCDSDDSCVYDSSTDCDPACGQLCSDPLQAGDIGAACEADVDCDGDATCYPEVGSSGPTGWPGGACLLFGCTDTSCPAGSSCIDAGDMVCIDDCGSHPDCRPGYACANDLCWPGCPDNSTCATGETCQAGTCAVPSCTPGSCGAGSACVNGYCVAMGDGPGANTAFPLGQLATLCPDLPPLECELGATLCGELVPFEPILGPGYDNYPLNGETAADQYRSFLRRDLMMLVKYAAAYVDCLAGGWSYGNGGALGLGDMSEVNGEIPGTRESDPGHPAGTHENGFDIDIAYFQLNTLDNVLRSVCPDTSSSGAWAYHCTDTPHLLDAWRSALFLGALAEHPAVRVIGVDGKAGQILEHAYDRLCADGWIDSGVCASAYPFTYEMINESRGWYYNHHHHLHLSLSQPDYTRLMSPLRGEVRDECLVPGCPAFTPAPYLP